MKYEVYIKGKPETAKEFEVTDEDLRNRYGKHAEEEGIDVLTIKPNPMLLKDLACSKGLFSWSDYPKLIGRKKK